MRKIGRGMGWLKDKLYEWSSHTDIEQALRAATAKGRRAGCELCPRCKRSKLVEIEQGLFNCPTCKQIDTGPHLAIPVKTGDRMRAWPLKVDTQQIEAVYAKNGPEYQQRLTQRLKRLPEEEVQ